MSMEFKEQMTPTLTLDSFEETEKTETTAAEFQEPVQKMEMQEKIVAGRRTFLSKASSLSSFAACSLLGSYCLRIFSASCRFLF